MLLDPPFDSGFFTPAAASAAERWRPMASSAWKLPRLGDEAGRLGPGGAPPPQDQCGACTPAAPVWRLCSCSCFDSCWRLSIQALAAVYLLHYGSAHVAVHCIMRHAAGNARPAPISPDRRQPPWPATCLAVYPGTFDPITLGHERRGAQSRPGVPARSSWQRGRGPVRPVHAWKAHPRWCAGYAANIRGLRVRAFGSAATCGGAWWRSHGARLARRDRL